MMDRGKSGLGPSARVAVLCGGPSAEREVSLVSGREVTKALRERGYRAVPMDVEAGLPSRLKRARVDVVFNALHGKIGEDGCVQGLLEVLRVPYTGSGVTASAVCMDKVRAKEVLLRHGIPTPRYEVVRKGDRRVDVRLPVPLVVKPRSEGSTLGVSIVRRKKDLGTALRRAFRFDREALIEAYIPGKELTVGVLNGKALGVLEIRPLGGFYDFETKYTAGRARHLYPAPLPPRLYERLKAIAARTCEILDCEAAPRVDFRVTPQGGVYVLEVNTLPGMTPLSLLPEIAHGEGIGFADLVERILLGARLKTQLRPEVTKGAGRA